MFVCKTPDIFIFQLCQCARAPRLFKVGLLFRACAHLAKLDIKKIRGYAVKRVLIVIFEGDRALFRPSLCALCLNNKFRYKLVNIVVGKIHCRSTLKLPIYDLIANWHTPSIDAFPTWKTRQSINHNEAERRPTCTRHPAGVRPLHEPGNGRLPGDGSRGPTEWHRHGGDQRKQYHYVGGIGASMRTLECCRWRK